MIAEVKELIEKMTAHRRELLDSIYGLDEDSAAVQPGGDWSVKQQIGHLVQAEARNGFPGQCR